MNILQDPRDIETIAGMLGCVHANEQLLLKYLTSLERRDVFLNHFDLLKHVNIKIICVIPRHSNIKSIDNFSIGN